MTYTPEDASTKETILKNSKESYMLLETRKLSKHGNYVYVSVNDFTGAVTEKPLTAEQSERLEAFGIKCI